MTAYPAAVPIAEINRFIAIIMGRAPRDVQVAAKDGWVIQGYLQGLLIGSADTPTDEPALELSTNVRIASNTTLSDAQGLALLLAVSDSTTSRTSGGSDALFMDNFRNIARVQLAGVLMPILLRWLMAFLVNGGLERIIESITNRSAGPMGAVECSGSPAHFS